MPLTVFVVVAAAAGGVAAGLGSSVSSTIPSAELISSGSLAWMRLAVWPLFLLGQPVTYCVCHPTKDKHLLVQSVNSLEVLSLLDHLRTCIREVLTSLDHLSDAIDGFVRGGERGVGCEGQLSDH